MWNYVDSFRFWKFWTRFSISFECGEEEEGIAFFGDNFIVIPFFKFVKDLKTTFFSFLSEFLVIILVMFQKSELFKFLTKNNWKNEFKETSLFWNSLDLNSAPVPYKTVSDRPETVGYGWSRYGSGMVTIAGKNRKNYFTLPSPFIPNRHWQLPVRSWPFRKRSRSNNGQIFYWFVK